MYSAFAWYGGTLNSRRAASPLVRLVKGEERWEAFDHPKSVLPLIWGGTEPNHTDTCMVLKATANDRRHLALCHGLREAGWSNRRIGRHLGRSDMVVARCWQQWITEGRVYRRGGSGRPRNTNDREDRAIRRVATSAPTTSLASIQRHLPSSRHPVPSRETIRRRLTEVGLRSRRPLRRLPLTPHHRQCRLDFCQPRATWSVTDWRRVIFSDESRFSLSDDDHRTRVWRRTGQRSDPAFIVERHTAISQGVTVWGAISWDTRSSLVVLQGTLTARRYVDDILTPIVLPMLSSRPGAIYQQDNARPHTARLSQQCLQGYDVLPWPARSPDLSPIERVWTRWEGNCSRPEIQEN
ncbi:transposable element Tc1 transposase [Trichonephila clavipes]|nr:transposable element Tc1 transposase [Trichonephila clavipes]